MTTTHLCMPPNLVTDQGQPRRVGIEIEFNGLSLADAIALVADQINGTIEHTGRYDARICNDPAGDWRVEIDFALLKKTGTARP